MLLSTPLVEPVCGPSIYSGLQEVHADVPTRESDSEGREGTRPPLDGSQRGVALCRFRGNRPVSFARPPSFRSFCASSRVARAAASHSLSRGSRLTPLENGSGGNVKKHPWGGGGGNRTRVRKPSTTTSTCVSGLWREPAPEGALPCFGPAAHQPGESRRRTYP